MSGGNGNGTEQHKGTSRGTSIWICPDRTGRCADQQISRRVKCPEVDISSRLNLKTFNLKARSIGRSPASIKIKSSAIRSRCPHSEHDTYAIATGRNPKVCHDVADPLVPTYAL